MEGSPWRIRHRSDPSEHSDWPPLRFSFRRFRSDPTSWKELLLKKKTDSPFSRIAGSRSVSQFSSISRSPFLPVRLQTFQSTRVILFFNIIYNICYLWRYCDYGDRRFESYERYFITLRYYWIELNAILKVKLSRRISKDILNNHPWWNKISKAICKDGKNDEGIGEITIVGRARLGTGRKEDGRARFSGSGSGFHRRKRRRVQEGWAAHGGCPLVNSGTQCRFCGRVSATRPSGTGPPLEWASR